jgi:hypothetical protein
VHVRDDDEGPGHGDDRQLLHMVHDQPVQFLDGRRLDPRDDDRASP